MNENPTIQVSAFPDPKELEDILVKFKKDEYTIEQAMYAIERIEEANIRFQNLALTQAAIEIADLSRQEQHQDFHDLINVMMKGISNARK